MLPSEPVRSRTSGRCFRLANERACYSLSEVFESSGRELHVALFALTDGFEEVIAGTLIALGCDKDEVKQVLEVTVYGNACRYPEP